MKNHPPHTGRWCWGHFENMPELLEPSPEAEFWTWTPEAPPSFLHKTLTSVGMLVSTWSCSYKVPASAARMKWYWSQRFCNAAGLLSRGLLEGAGEPGGSELNSSNRISYAPCLFTWCCIDVISQIRTVGMELSWRRSSNSPISGGTEMLVEISPFSAVSLTDPAPKLTCLGNELSVSLASAMWHLYSCLIWEGCRLMHLDVVIIQI